MNTEIISVGTELLMGEILNTDVKFLSERLSMMGINVFYQTVVGDNKKRLSEVLDNALSRAELIIVSGGLGPTPDDLTKEVISERLGEKLVLDKKSLDAIKEYFKRTNRKMPESNIKQAMLPENSIILPNDNGTAPGCIIEKNGKTVVMLPGPYRELVMMFDRYVSKYIAEKNNKVLISHTFKLFGVGESYVAEIFKDMIENGTNPTLAPYAETAGVRLRLAASAENEAEAKEKISEARKDIIEKIGEYIYAEEDKTLAEVTVRELIRKKITVSAAESCTGGMLAKMIVDIPGCSEILGESFVTYSNEAKMKHLGVSAKTLKEFGAVSEQTAKEMAEGVRRASSSEIGVGITGIAGPDGGTPDKPVGLVYVSVAYNNKTEVRRLMISGDREKVRYTASLNVFDMILRRIK